MKLYLQSHLSQFVSHLLQQMKRINDAPSPAEQPEMGHRFLLFDFCFLRMGGDGQIAHPAFQRTASVCFGTAGFEQFDDALLFLSVIHI